jgi:4-amino-4-deoxy-L-arabinose transferase-like glycosyltransferase
VQAARSSFYFCAALGVIGLGTIFHLVYSTHLELVGDEAYYWLWSRHPDICYLDKGLMIAWLIAAGTALFGKTVFGVRFFAVMLAGGTGFAIFLLARRLFSDRVAFWAVVVAGIIPLFAVGSSLMTIDTLYVFFWSWAALAFWWAKDRSTLGPWVLTGALVGLGLLSKYTAAIELISFAAFCLWDQPSRIHLRRATFWTMLVTALLFLVPAIIWNVQHRWPTIAWLLQRGGLNKLGGFHPGFVLDFLTTQAGVISPLLFLGLLFVFFRPRLWRSPQPATAYAAALFLPLFGLYLLLSFHYRGQPNWTAAAYVGGIVLLAAKWLDLVKLHSWARWLAVAALLLAAAETIILLDTRWLNLPRGRDPLDRARGSRNLAAQVARWQQATGAKFIIGDHYMVAALLSFYLPGQPKTFVPVVSPPSNQLELWPTFDQLYPTSDGLIVAKHPKLVRSLPRSFARVKSLGRIDVVDGGRKIATYYLFLGERERAPVR